MRKIKFRVWNVESKRMKVTGIGLSGGEIFAEPDGPLMQFTGLMDKNGKEIFEGDILKSTATGMLYPVTWWAEKCRFRAIKKNLILDPAKAWKNAEIIGNIYENPELLS